MKKIRISPIDFTSCSGDEGLSQMPESVGNACPINSLEPGSVSMHETTVVKQISPDEVF